MKALLGTKIGMTQVIGADGIVVPVTLICAKPATVTQVKSSDKDGYMAVQVGYGEGKNLSKAVAGHVAPAKIEPQTIKEFRVDELPEGLKVGDSLTVEQFEVGQKVNVTGVSKGKGFAGTIKRHGFKRQPKSHGGQGNVRRPGSIGSMYPQKIFKGKKMAGRMGGERTTVKNLQVVVVDPEAQVVGLKGAVPGPKRGLVVIRGEE